MAASVPVTTTAAPLQSLKRRRRGSLEQEEHQGGGGGRGGVQQYEVDPEESASTVKVCFSPSLPLPPVPQLHDATQLS